MKNAAPQPSEIASQGAKIYQEKLRPLLEPAHNGKIVVINVHTGEFELDNRHLAALDRARARWPDEIFFAARVGFPTLGHIGTRFRAKAE